MADYSKFNKEHGCSRCAFGFCNKCIKNKFIIPNLSPQPVSVCNNCYNILTGKVTQIDNRSRGLATKSIPSTAKLNNWWGDDKLPPPSMRIQYEKEKKTVSKNDLSNLSKEKFQNRKVPSLYEIEERLSALRGVSIDIIQKPRLMIINSDENDFSNTDHFRNEAQELLNAVEAKSKINFLHHGYDNPALQLDDNLSLDSKKQSDCSLNLNSQILSTKTINSSFVKQITQNNQNNLSIKSNSQSDLSLKCVYPNFSDCIRETICDAEKIEHDALIYIQQLQSQKQQSVKKTSKNIETSYVNKSQTTNLKKLVSVKTIKSPKKKAITFFHRIFK